MTGIDFKQRLSDARARLKAQGNLRPSLAEVVRESSITLDDILPPMNRRPRVGDDIFGTGLRFPGTSFGAVAEHAQQPRELTEEQKRQSELHDRLERSSKS